MKSLILHVLIDTKENEDVFRDIEISEDASLEELHDAILDAFDFKGDEMASFFQCDEDWNKGQEYPQIGMDDEDDLPSMANSTVDDLFGGVGDKAIYTYDFLRMWNFLIEVINTKPIKTDKGLPKVLLSVGKAPKEHSRDVNDTPNFEADPNYSDDNFDWDNDDDEFEDEGDYESFDDDYRY
ncbi:MAG: IS1096 element passenger TnpR family protein [Luteibaculum sp.]